MLRAPTAGSATARLKGMISSYLRSMQSSCSYHIQGQNADSTTGVIFKERPLLLPSDALPI